MKWYIFLTVATTLVLCAFDSNKKSLFHSQFKNGAFFFHREETESGTTSIMVDDTSFSFEMLGQCWLSLPYKFNNDSIKLSWKPDLDCVIDFDPNLRFENMGNPKIGKPFAIAIMKPDSSLSIQYLYPEWIKKFNMKQRIDLDIDFDIFPDKLLITTFKTAE